MRGDAHQRGAALAKAARGGGELVARQQLAAADRSGRRRRKRALPSPERPGTRAKTLGSSGLIKAPGSG